MPGFFAYTASFQSGLLSISPRLLHLAEDDIFSKIRQLENTLGISPNSLATASFLSDSVP
jgi:hypothetical protein